MLGVGVDRDAAFCLSSGGRARLSPGFGDLATGLARRAYVEALERARQSHDIEPEAVSRDLDASSFAASLAAELELPAVAVQHHHAHAAAVMAEHGLEGRVLAVVLDEPGLGDDGTTWGGEFLVADAVEARRAGHLRAVPGPGSNGMGVVYAADAGVLRRAASMLGPNVTREPPTGGGAERTLPDTSAGGLFDAVASLAGLRGHHRGAGRGWVRLARAADGSATMEYPFDLGTDDGSLVLDTRPIVRAVVKDLGNGRSAGTVAGRFHRTMAAGILAICRLLRIDTGLDRVVLAGALFADGLLVSDTAARLATQGFHVYPPQRIPPGDASLALGQVLVASARLGRPAA
ncbi:MAG TPA: hypothetical protein VGB19_14475 [Actinomycetota bacterium]